MEDKDKLKRWSPEPASDMPAQPSGTTGIRTHEKYETQSTFEMITRVLGATDC